MRQSRLMWLAFATAVAVVLASMGWVTRAVLRLDAAEAESRRRAQFEENVRLALWRMDSALAPLIAAEHARPASALAAPVSAPLPGTQTPFVESYFRYMPDGADPLGALGPYDRLVATLPPPAAAALPPPAPGQEPEAYAQAQVKGAKQQRGYQEFQARAANTQQQVEVQSNVNRSVYDLAPADVSAGPLRPIWADGALVLARRVASGRRESVQACRVDWPAVNRWLTQSVKDLLPDARLVPVTAQIPIAEADTRLLASIPARLDPGPLVVTGEEAGASPLKVSLWVAWSCVLAATGAVGLLLAGVASLSERRGAFVSAVTHELRTPLTTLRMYTEMLADGMVADPSQQRSYLQTLRAESDRLGHLVENVLAYSRLERNRAGYEVSDTALGEVTKRTVERLAERAKQAGMQLQADVPAKVAETRVRANALALEQILFNLVDNACKYAAGAADRTIDVTASADAESVHIRVRDYGPGIAPSPAGRLFHPFKKSVQEAADSAPGLGLGLALSRRLARSMGGDLRVDRAVAGGAALVLSLRRA